jgi:predicted glycoside hydrolase/deacetylase ChbG (UPF0249 family)
VARARSLPVRAASGEALRSLRAAGVKTPDRFVDRFYGEHVSFETLERLLEEIPEGTTELMCHPGHPDADLKSGSTYVDERAQELELLCDPGIRSLVKMQKIELVGFDAL